MNTVVNPDPLLELTSWAPPAWTESIETNGDLIEYSRILGSVPRVANAAGEAIAVILVQRDEVRVDQHRICVFRYPAEVLAGGVSLRPDEAETLARFLDTATALIARSA